VKGTRLVGLVVLLAVAAAGIAVAMLVRRGVSARDTPTAPEVVLARGLRRLAAPSGARALANPVALDDGALGRARAHFADHCALCHGNDGRGRTEIGQKLYPKAPDMTAAATQSLSDGEIFFIIKNGVRLTGMPAWGEDTPEEDRQTWELVHFVRHLPRITPEELREMESLNPRSPRELDEEKAIEQFLEGADEGHSATH
jgi:mono/diheme cytochrome c family protein